MQQDDRQMNTLLESICKSSIPIKSWQVSLKLGFQYLSKHAFDTFFCAILPSPHNYQGIWEAKTPATKFKIELHVCCRFRQYNRNLIESCIKGFSDTIYVVMNTLTINKVLKLKIVIRRI